MPSVTQKPQATQVHAVDDYKTTIYAEAQKLLSDGARPGDTIETYRNGKLSMSGNVAACGRLVVKEARHRLYLHYWKAFAGPHVESTSAQDGLHGRPRDSIAPSTAYPAAPSGTPSRQHTTPQGAQVAKGKCQMPTLITIDYVAIGLQLLLNDLSNA